MDKIGSLRDDKVIAFFKGEMSLISSSVVSIQILSVDGEAAIDLSVRLLYSKGKRDFIIKFIGVEEYCFYHEKDHDFYNVERLKFLKDEGVFYISLDPDVSVSGRAESDNDFIVSRELALEQAD